MDYIIIGVNSSQISINS